jgi:hypothetical protein
MISEIFGPHFYFYPSFKRDRPYFLCCLFGKLERSNIYNIRPFLSLKLSINLPSVDPTIPSPKKK